MTGVAATARMPMPRAWLALALLAWGVLADAVAGAVAMALVLEALALSPVKWDIARRDFHRAADLTSIIFALVTLIQFQRYSVHGIYELLRVAPYCLFPLVLVQRASSIQAVPLSALIYGLRRRPQADRTIDVAPYFLAACMLASSITEASGAAYAALAALLVLGVILSVRPRRYVWWQPAMALVLVAAFAAATHSGIRHARHALESAFLYWFHQMPWTGSEHNRAFTAIGAIGRLKLSDAIRVRVAPAPHLSIPLILQEASYDTFTYGTWSASAAPFEAIDKDAGRDSWALARSSAAPSRPIEITVQHARELTLLPLPRATASVTSAEIAELQRNRFGSILAEAAPGALRFTARDAGPGAGEPPPTPRDLHVPAQYAAVLDAVAQEAGLRGDATPGAVGRVRRFFLDGFKYTLVQRGDLGRRLPLTHFLQTSRRGHCEHFASASVLLLRRAGIPARYAVGYVVESYSELERAWIARARHAHAWALAWVDGRWITVDATPGVWFDLEERRSSPWQTVNDLLGWLRYRLQRLSRVDFSTAGAVLPWLVPPLALVLYVRLRRSPTAVRDTRRVLAAGATPVAPLAPVFDALAARGLHPVPGETVARFLRRAAPPRANGETRAAIVHDYYRIRFAGGPGARTDDDLRARIARYAAGI